MRPNKAFLGVIGDLNNAANVQYLDRSVGVHFDKYKQ